MVVVLASALCDEIGNGDNGLLISDLWGIINALLLAGYIFFGGSGSKFSHHKPAVTIHLLDREIVLKS